MQNVIASGSQEEIVEFLIEKGADVYIEDEFGNNCFEISNFFDTSFEILSKYDESNFELINTEKFPKKMMKTFQIADTFIKFK